MTSIPIHELGHVQALDQACNDAVYARITLERRLEETKRLLREVDAQLAEARQTERQAHAAYCETIAQLRQQIASVTA